MYMWYTVHYFKIYVVRFCFKKKILLTLAALSDANNRTGVYF
jgi:hypothetical protein